MKSRKSYRSLFGCKADTGTPGGKKEQDAFSVLAEIVERNTNPSEPSAVQKEAEQHGHKEENAEKNKPDPFMAQTIEETQPDTNTLPIVQEGAEQHGHKEENAEKDEPDSIMAQTIEETQPDTDEPPIIQEEAEQLAHKEESTEKTEPGPIMA